MIIVSVYNSAVPKLHKLITFTFEYNLGIYGQGSQKLYNWQNIVSPPHYRNDVHHPHDIICLYCRGLQDESEYIYFYIVYVSHLSSIDEYCRTFGSNTVILACLQTNIAHSNLLHKKSINCNQTI